MQRGTEPRYILGDTLKMCPTIHIGSAHAPRQNLLEVGMIFKKMHPSALFATDTTALQLHTYAGSDHPPIGRPILHATWNAPRASPVNQQRQHPSSLILIKERYRSIEDQLPK